MFGFSTPRQPQSNNPFVIDREMEKREKEVQAFCTAQLRKALGLMENELMTVRLNVGDKDA